MIGFKTVEITEKHLGQKMAQFVSIEVKSSTGRLSKTQHNWLETVKKAGGITGVARTVKDAFEILKIV